MQETINPYRVGAGLILRKLKWDLYYESHSSRHKLTKARNKFCGQKAIIICNGPSLNKVDFDKLSKTFCIGLNKINLLFDKTSFRPDCITSVNPYVIEQNADFYNDTNIDLYLDSYARRAGLVRPRKNVTYMFSGPKGFARDCSASIYQGHTVTYIGLQLAYHLGFEQVGLIGCDHNFASKGPANELVNTGAIDHNHFDPRYFANLPWQLPDLAESEASYAMAHRVFHENNRVVYNCTDGGNLELLPRKTLDDFLRA